ncbi:histidine kinase dimerization/phosphoacceptor domain -containing protein [Sphingomonas sp. 2R-10]|uniref:histidine kinase dimerization/phosphoacceptor domain -containing protein n=1 Tax=Sphingomonas sp. 2R-10 TaxID=3045148 RepID=UPI000F7762D2|nr:histidine kinase dimerization/phosphoacceptor domain -containing protein [Sphingomonas sp. 2R-10]MDJ0275672.1 histidine kinase dimerization/phosphoacceptor domain -containing protein [Sphingomonas sp. 2R-10]
MIDPASTDMAVDGMPRRHLRLLGEAADRLLAADDPAGMVDDLFTLIADELRLDVFFNYRLDGDALLLETHGGLTSAEAASFERLAIGEAVCGCVARDRRPIATFGVQRSDDPMAKFVRALGVDAYVCTPLMHGSTLLGTLSFGRRWSDRFEPDELAFIRTVCHYVALAKHRLRIEAELREGIAVRERLLAELNHRVRNALQTAVAVVRLGAADLTDGSARGALADAAARLEVLAAAHRPLYATDSPSRIDIVALIGSIAERTDDEPVAILGTGNPSLAIEQAAAVALLTHAFIAVDPDALAQVAIDATADALRLTLTGTDMGRPRPAIDDGRLVRGLARQLRADVARDGAGQLTILIPGRAHG